WGLAKATGRSDPSAGERTLRPSSASGSAETLPGSALGTPAYMSPEQAGGDLDRLGPRGDGYSLGATLHCLLTGRPPVGGEVGDAGGGGWAGGGGGGGGGSAPGGGPWSRRPARARLGRWPMTSNGGWPTSR